MNGNEKRIAVAAEVESGPVAVGSGADGADQSEKLRGDRDSLKNVNFLTFSENYVTSALRAAQIFKICGTKSRTEPRVMANPRPRLRTAFGHVAVNFCYLFDIFIQVLKHIALTGDKYSRWKKLKLMRSSSKQLPGKRLCTASWNTFSILKLKLDQLFVLKLKQLRETSENQMKNAEKEIPTEKMRCGPADTTDAFRVRLRISRLFARTQRHFSMFKSSFV